MRPLRVFVGYQTDRPTLFEVAKYSIERRTSVPVTILPLMWRSLRATGLYTRPTETRNGQLWDTLSDAPMSTEFALSRFLVPHLVNGEGWALSIDDDMLCLDDIARLFALADDRYAVMVVKHAEYVPEEAVKLDNKAQTTYQRKNWSSVILWNCAHPAHQALTLDAINGWRGLKLHQFGWLSDGEIGRLPIEWNWLVDHYDWPDTADPSIGTPSLVHFTRGGPWLPEYQDVPFADLWRREKAILDISRERIKADDRPVVRAFLPKRG